MLGSVEATQRWIWTAYGKHPVAKDYFSLGRQNAPLLQAMSDWVEQGYRTLASKREPSPEPSSWRFWARGPGEGTLSCGIVKQSADGIGRPFPLLLSGIGPLRGWEEQWDLIPFACERTWNQMERISIKGFEGLDQLDAEIRKISAPSPQWSDYAVDRGELGQSELSFSDASYEQTLEDYKKQVATLAERSEIFIRLDEKPTYDQFTLISLWHSSIRSGFMVTPNAVFMGGTLETAYLAVFQRPLMPADFVRLWSISSSEKSENGSLGTR